MNLHIISAGAGSGKTYTLTKLMSDLLNPNPNEAATPIRASGILATTFTRKAAAELKERVRIKLLEEGLTRQADELENALIGTVHSIGAQLLKRFAFEVGISPNVEVMADDDAQILFNQSLTSVLSLDKIQEMNSLAAKLGYYKNSSKPSDWRKELRYIMDYARANNFDTEAIMRSKAHSLASYSELLPERSDRSLEWWDTTLRRLLADTLEAIKQNEDKTKKKETLIKNLEGFMHSLQLGKMLHWYEWVQLEKGCIDAPAKCRDEVMDLLEFARKHVEHPHFHQQTHDFVNNLFDLAAEALTEYARYKKQRGLIDYIDMEALLVKLLADNDVRAVLADELDLLLVDEFQDTNPIQLSIFLELTKLVKRAIWVGDPKQSIYGFRGAAPELMEAIVKEAQSLQILGTSWRSRADLVFAVNGLFVEAFKNTLSPDRVALQPAPPYAKALENTALDTAVLQWNFKPETDKSVTNDLFARYIARAVAEMLRNGTQVRIKGSATNETRPIRPSDIAILCRTNANCQKFAETLAQEGLEASISQQGLLHTPEALLVQACLKYVLNEYDTLAVAEIMRLAALYPIEKIIDHRLAYLNAMQAEDFDKKNVRWGMDEPILQALAQVRQRTRELSASEILNLLLEKLEIRRMLAAWSSPQRRIANVEMLRSYALQYEESCTRLHSAATLGGFMLWLDQLGRNDKDDQAIGGGENAVQVLTYHASKGLEWSVVLCCDLDNSLRDPMFGLRMVKESGKLDINNPLAGRLICYWLNPYADQVKNTYLQAMVDAHESRPTVRQEALNEETRLLYVGLTRACDYLVLPTAAKRSTKWLNRVFHHGQEEVPTLLGVQNVLPWLWEGDEIALDYRDFIYPLQFEVTPLPHEPILHLPKFAGETHYPSAFVDTARWLVPDIISLAQTHISFYKPYALPVEDEYEADYDEVANMFSEFICADDTTVLDTLRYQSAKTLLYQYELADWFIDQDMLNYSDALFGALRQIAPFATVRHFYPFQYSNHQQTYQSTIDLWITTATGEELFITYPRGQTGNIHQHKELSLAQAYHLYAAALALCKGNASHCRYFVFFVLEGQLYELKIEEKSTAPTLFDQPQAKV